MDGLEQVWADVTVQRRRPLRGEQHLLHRTLGQPALDDRVTVSKEPAALGKLVNRRRLLHHPAVVERHLGSQTNPVAIERKGDVELGLGNPFRPTGHLPEPGKRRFRLVELMERHPEAAAEVVKAELVAALHNPSIGRLIHRIPSAIVSQPLSPRGHRLCDQGVWNDSSFMAVGHVERSVGNAVLGFDVDPERRHPGGFHGSMEFTDLPGGLDLPHARANAAAQREKRRRDVNAADGRVDRTEFSDLLTRREKASQVGLPDFDPSVVHPDVVGIGHPESLGIRRLEFVVDALGGVEGEAGIDRDLIGVTGYPQALRRLAEVDPHSLQPTVFREFADSVLWRTEGQE